ncbi:protein kinase [uncultured Massilia sp.]|uniref:protein kinase domain-containing protein n=1 Tax=uncultured Massilia sp. TaxID=169973 RepID=UPI0025FE2FC3|nr:protein kinase [uncultured Massilia sp.]
MADAGDIVALEGAAWRLCERLAGSSYGVVWRAESLGGGAPAALKLVNHEQMALALPPQRARWSASAEAEIAFLRALQPWDRRHIVRLLDSGMHDGQPALALELLDGDLARHLAGLRAQGAAVDCLQALDWTGQVNQALAKVHQYGWRYLDLKPSNLLLDAGSKTLKLADFGTNRPLLDASAHSYAGTAGWQAPEQFFPDAADRYHTDARSDYFALGALLYHLVTGAVLRHGARCAQARRAHGNAAAAQLLAAHGARPDTLAPDEAAHFTRAALGDAGHAGPAHAALLALLRALLAPDPCQRPRHALEISRLLAAATDAVRVHAGARPTTRAAA